MIHILTDYYLELAAGQTSLIAQRTLLRGAVESTKDTYVTVAHGWHPSGCICASAAAAVAD